MTTAIPPLEDFRVLRLAEDVRALLEVVTDLGKGYVDELPLEEATASVTRALEGLGAQGATVIEATAAAQRELPAVRPVSCIEVRCSACGWGWEEGLPHFTSLQDAQKHTAELWGWDWTDPGAPRCGECIVAAACREHGHNWGRWHEPAYGPRVRFCEREVGDYTCSASERFPVEDVPTGGLT